jgi:hypothetical protein
MDCRVIWCEDGAARLMPGNDEMETRSRDTSVAASLRGAIATKQSRIPARAIWIASLTLAMTQAPPSSRHVMSESCPRQRAKIDSPPATKEGAERREAHPTDAAQHRSALPLLDALRRGARRRQVYAVRATHLLAGRARLPALCCGSRQGERIRRWLSFSSRVS